MCGVAGILSKTETVDPILIHKMAQSLTHRGPDGYDTYQENGFHCSHNLLSLHSKLTKPGPYLSQNERWVLSFNGEIYNHKDLKEEINRHNSINWRHHSDAEILLEGWSLEGKDFLKKINGMFAFSIWDRVSKTLYLANDQLAEKNLYYTIWNNQFLFSSEIKGFMAINYPLNLNSTKLDEYLSYRYVSGRETLFKNVLKLEQAQILEVSNDLTLKYHPYKEKKINHYRLNSQTEILQELIQSAVELRTSSIHTNSLYLSSGLDSTLIANYLPENSYAITLINDSKADLVEINKVCKKQNFIKKEVSIPQDVTSLLDECIYAVEEPIGDSIQISNMILAKGAKEHNIRISFTGDGADEIFAGYIHHLAYSLLLDLHQKFGPRLLSGICQTLNLIPEKLVSYLAPYSQNLGSESKKRLMTIMNQYLKKQNCISEMTQVFKIHHLNSEINRSEIRINTLKDLLNHDQKHWLPNYVLMRNDKILMSQSIEGRYPYLDNRIVDFTTHMPSQFFIDGFERKATLKKASLTHLSKKQAYQKKKSFIIDFNIEQLLHYTEFKNSFLSEFIKSQGISFKKTDFIDQKKIFSLIVIQRWMNKFGLN